MSLSTPYYKEGGEEVFCVLESALHILTVVDTVRVCTSIFSSNETVQ